MGASRVFDGGRRRRLFFSALAMTAITLVLKLVDTVFGVWLSNRLGAQGVGLYQLVTSVYGFAVTFSISGLSFTVTRLASEAIARGRRPFRAVAACAALSLCFSLTAAAVLFFGAGYIAQRWLGDARAALSLRAFAFALPFLAMSACLRGYFISAQKALLSSAGDVLEQLLRIGVVTAAITLLMPPDVEYACCAIVIGSVASELASFIYYLVLTLREKRRCLIPGNAGRPPRMLKSVLRISVPVALGAYLRSALVTAENLLIPRGLVRFGLPRAEALAQYGLVKGMALPVLTFPSAVIASFALLLVPEVAQTSIRGERERIAGLTAKALRATFLYSALASGVFLCFGRRLGALLYPDADAGRYIFILAPIIPLIYVDFVVDSLLKALDLQVTSLKFNTIDALFRTSLVLLLLPLSGMRGYVMILFAGAALNAALSLGKLLRVSGVKPRLRRWIFLPALCSAAAGAISLLPLRLLGGGAAALAASILLAALLYFLFLRLTGCVTKEDVGWFLSALGFAGRRSL